MIHRRQYKLYVYLKTNLTTLRKKTFPVSLKWHVFYCNYIFTQRNHYPDFLLIHSAALLKRMWDTCMTQSQFIIFYYHNPLKGNTTKINISNLLIDICMFSSLELLSIVMLQTLTHGFFFFFVVNTWLQVNIYVPIFVVIYIEVKFWNDRICACSALKHIIKRSSHMTHQLYFHHYSMEDICQHNTHQYLAS